MALAVVLALDVGGTKIAGGLIDPDGRMIRYDDERATPHSENGGDPGLTETVTLAAGLHAHAVGQGWQVTGIGAGFPEYVDGDGRLTSHEVLAWTDQPANLLAAACPGAPCAIESDVRCGAVAEWRLGAGSDYPGLFYVSLGTGLSSAVIVDGRVVRGARGEAIALGELGVPASVESDWSDNLETYASGHGLARRYAAATGEQASARRLAALATAGDSTARHILESAGQALGSVLADLVAVLDPPVVVLGGGLGTADTPLAEAVRRTYYQRTDRRASAPPLLTARLGRRAGLIGAALLASPGHQ